ncbi:MAG: asparagine synthase (glutamine-hydrolyzing) [Casimicrobiaceae bacterium]
MCGIAGIIDSTQATPPGVLHEMLTAIRHRGPDGEGIHVEPGVAIGMRRLAVIDLATGNQPLRARGGQVLVFQNGEIYNYRALRGELERAGCAFATASDTEILAQGYDRWGIDGLLARVDGMYAFAILDRDARVLHLARDRFGEKPLFYAAKDGRFAYSSDLGTLAALPWVGARIDPLSLSRYLALHYVPGEATIYRHVRRVLPGERLEIALDAPSAKRVRYYVPPLAAAAPLADDALAALVEHAVASRLVADVPVGAFLSGGLDSSIVAAVAARHLPGVLTFSMGFASVEHDESEFARELATTIASRHHHFRFDESSFATLLPEVAAALDEPVGDQAMLPVYWLAREARQHATVVLSGEGADEVFAGYGYYGPFAPNPGMLANVKRALGADDPTTATHLIDNTPPVTPSGFPLLTDYAGRARLMPGAVPEVDAWEATLLRWLAAAHDPLQRATAADLATWLPDDLLVKYDRMAMAVSLEGRAPFLQPDLVAAALALPPAERMSGGQSKVALRRIAKRWLPERIHARRKQGFVLPMRTWTRDWLHSRGGPTAYFSAHAIPGIDTAELVAVVDTDLAAGVQRERLLFALIMLAEWYAASSARVARIAARYAA